MLQEKINELIENNWTTKGIELLPTSLVVIWKEFNEDFNLDSKAKQVVNSFLNKTRNYNSYESFNEASKNANLDLLSEFEMCFLDQLSFTINDLGNNFFLSTKINNNFSKVETFFNFLWYGLVPIFYYKTFNNLLKLKNDFFPNLVDDLSIIIYGKVVDESTITLNRLNPSTKTMFIIVDNLLNSLRNKE